MNQLSIKKMNIKLIFVNIGLILLYFLVQIFVTSALGTRSEKIEQIRTEKISLRLENELLNAEIDKERSLNNAEELMLRFGLEKKEVRYIEDFSDDLANVR